MGGEREKTEEELREEYDHLGAVRAEYNRRFGRR